LAAIPQTPAGPRLTPLEFDRIGQVKVALLALGFFAVFRTVLYDLNFKWQNNADWSHGPLIPLFSLYLLYLRWPGLRVSPVRYTGFGLAVFLGGLALFQLSQWWITYSYLPPAAMLLTLLGIALFLCGLPALRFVAVPWLYLFFAVPLPKGLYFSITNPMREIAATVATWVLGQFPDLSIERLGSTIHYMYQGRSGQLGVADACSGMRSAMTLCALGVAIAFISERPWWQRAILIASCVPIAVFSNFIRVITTCLIHIYGDPRYAEGTYHTALGLVTIMIAFGMFSGLGWILSNLVVDAGADEEPGSQADAVA
jgi:exosortase